MYKIKSVKINNFWHRFNAACDFDENVNIIIGKNGTGKTTFMNILHAVLSVDVDGIIENDFESVVITLINNKNKNKKTIKVKKIDKDNFPFLLMEYQISQKKYKVRILSAEDRRMALHYRRKTLEESEELRGVLSRLVSLSSLSVYRLRSGDDYELRDKRGTQIISPVDYKLSELLGRFTRYQLELSQLANHVSTNLQKDVLTSILYSQNKSERSEMSLNFNKKEERHKLVTAFSQLDVMDAGVRKKINYHVDAIDKAVKAIESENMDSVNFLPLEALGQTKTIIQLALDAEKKTSEIFSQITLFINTLKKFISDKTFSFHEGGLLIEANNNEDKITYKALSSGEKQLLIIFIETLLQKQSSHVFLTDEPELSLHISWQREIIPAIKELNPNAQVIAATHSPEIASRYRDFIFDMEELIHG